MFKLPATPCICYELKISREENFRSHAPTHEICENFQSRKFRLCSAIVEGIACSVVGHQKGIVVIILCCHIPELKPTTSLKQLIVHKSPAWLHLGGHCTVHDAYLALGPTKHPSNNFEL